MVRYHGLPLWVFEKPNPVQALLKASLEVNIKWLAISAKADVLGRICSNANELLYKIELFIELAIEYSCWGHSKVFASSLSRFQYFRKGDRHPDFETFYDTKTKVIILSGIARNGKDFYIKKNHPSMAFVSLDDMRRKAKSSYGDTKGNGRIIQAAKELKKQYLPNRVSFIWNATNITVQMREQLIDLFEPYKLYVKVVYIETPYQKLLAQNRHRQERIPQHAVKKMIDKLEVPKLWEAMEVNYVTA